MMLRWTTILLATTLCLLCLTPAAAQRTTSAMPAKDAMSAEDVPVVVELFTSQGCSSCPPADRLLSRLRQQAPAGVEVIPLSFHVDYWDYIGWQDPFASPAWSQRQRAYAASFDASRIYTPQMVVNGTSECVGSQAAEVQRLVVAAAKKSPPARISLQVERVPGAEMLRIEAGAAVPADFVAGGRLSLYVALFENGLTTPVGRGENASRTLHNDFVVRHLQPVLALDGTLAKEGVLQLPIEADWGLAQLGVVAFLQESGSRAIHGARSMRLAVTK